MSLSFGFSAGSVGQNQALRHVMSLSRVMKQPNQATVNKALNLVSLKMDLPFCSGVDSIIGSPRPSVILLLCLCRLDSQPGVCGTEPVSATSSLFLFPMMYDF